MCLSAVVDKNLKSGVYSKPIGCNQRRWKGASSMSNTIEIKYLSKMYGHKRVLNDINLTIEPGMFGLLGRNGAGKTTLMKTLATLTQKSEGEVTLCGIPVENAKEIRKIIGYLPQEFSIYPTMRVQEALDYLGVLCQIDTKHRRPLVEQLLHRVNLWEHRNVRIKALSGGMKRRLGIAQALLNDPKVLIVDEPTAGLDPEERIRFRNLLCQEAQNRIVLLSTHIVGDIEATCETLAILNEGQLLYNGSVDELLKTAQGRVFTLAAPQSQLPELKKQLAITSMHTQGKQVFLRFLSQTPVAGAEACDANIEDAYLLALYENGVGSMNLTSGGEDSCYF